MIRPRHSAIAFTLVACSPADPPTPEIQGVTCVDAPAPSISPAVVPGTASQTDDFVPLDDGTTLARTFGPQGGTHLDLAARIHVDPPADTLLEVEIEDHYIDPTTLAAEACPNWTEAFFRVYDPPSAPHLIYRVLDADDGAELTTATVDITVR